MNKTLVPLVVVTTFILGSGAMAAGRSVPLEPEGCQVVNPGQPTCTYTVTHSGESPVTGFAGTGSWQAKIKRGKKTTTVKSPGPGEPPAVAFEFVEGDKVTLTALAPGSAATAGHVD